MRYSLPQDVKIVEDRIYKCCVRRCYRMGQLFDLTPEIHAHLKRAARWLTDQNDKPWIMFAGYLGNGKTCLALGVLEAFRILGPDTDPTLQKTIRFMEAKDICELAATDRKAYQNLVTCDFLVIDDLGYEPIEITSYGMLLTPVIDLLAKRYRMRLQTVITTNLQGHEFEPRYGARIVDRIKEAAVRLPFKDTSFRLDDPEEN